jgi:predicted HicB family RNase H-like nuclease
MAKTKHAKTFDTRLCVGVPSAVAEATTSAASQRLESLNVYVRRALLAQLRQDGFALPPRDGRAAT